MSNLKENLLTIYKIPKDEVVVDSKLKEDIYDELTIKSVSDLITLINQYTPLVDNITFCDIGSGTGKILMHVLCVTRCKNVIGIEKNKKRCTVSKNAFKSLKGMDKKKMKIINDDIMNIEKFGHVNYLNDLNFPSKYTSHVWNKLEPDTILITHKKIGASYPIGKMVFRMENKKEPFYGLIYRKPNVDGGIPSRLGLNKV